MMLADYYDDERQVAWPTQERLAEDCQMGVRSIQRHLRNLAKDGFIFMEQRGNQHRLTHYALNIVAGAQTYVPANGVPAKLAGTRSPKVSTRHPAYRAPATAPARAPVPPTPEPSIEPSITLPALSVPAFYDALLELPTFDEPLAKCVQWIEANDVSAARAEETALAMVARLTWNDKKSRYEYLDAGGKTRTYTAVWPTFRSWAKREPLSTNGRYSNRGRRVEELPGKEAFKEPWL